MKQIFIATASAALGLAGCGGEKTEADKSEIKIDASKAKGGEIADLYVAHMTNVADAIEKVDDEKSAKAAAAVIAKAVEDMEKTAENVEGMSATRRAMLFASRAQDFAEPQMRMSQSMTKLASENPELLEIIQKELEKMPDFAENE